MAAADCTVYGIKGQAIRVYGWVKDSTTGNPIATIGTLSAVISQDGVYNASAPTPQAVTSHNGRFYIELSASQNDYYNVGITVISDTADALYATIDVTNLDLSEVTGAWWDQTVKRFEQMVLQGVQYLLGRAKRNISTGTITVYKQDDSTVIGTMSRTQTSTDIEKGSLS